MAHTAFLIWLVGTVSGCCKYGIGLGSINSGYITKLEQSTFLYISMVSCRSRNNDYYMINFDSVINICLLANILYYLQIKALGASLS
jgi:hypothetical protein